MNNTPICAAALAGMFLLNACTKEANPSPATASSTTTTSTATGGGSGGTASINGGSGSSGGGISVPTGGARMSYGLRASNTTAGLAQRTSAGGTLQWTGGIANPREVRFEARLAGNSGGGGNSGSGNSGSGSGGNGSSGSGSGGSNNGKIEYRSTSTAQVNLFAAATALFSTTPLPAGTYKELELRVKLERSGTTPAFQLTGTYSSTTVTALPVVLQVTDICELRVEAEDVTIDSTTLLDATTLISLASLTDGITETMLAGATLTAGTLVISASSNADLYDIIVDNLKAGRHGCDVQPHH